MSGAGTADAVAIAASRVIAPATDIAFGAVHKYPATIKIGADLQASLRLVNEGFGEGACNFREVRFPAILSGEQGEREPILVLYHARKNRYLQPAI